MNIYLIMMEITPSKDNDVDDCVGAYANCFVKAPSIDIAIITGEKYIEEQKWIVKSVEETASVLREEYVDDIELLNAYDEACEYGVSAIFYTWDEDDSE